MVYSVFLVSSQPQVTPMLIANCPLPIAHVSCIISSHLISSRWEGPASPNWTALYISTALLHFSLALVQQPRNVWVQPVFMQHFRLHRLGPGDPAPALLRTAGTLEGLVHLPLGTGVEEGEGVALLQGPVIHDANLHARHVEDQRGRARVIAEDQVGIELDVGVAAGLHAGVGLDARSGRGDFGKECAGGQIDEGNGAAAKGLGTAIDVQSIGMGRDRRCDGSQWLLEGDRGDGGGRHGDGGGGEVKVKRKR